MKDKTLDEQLEYLKGLGVKEINKATKLATNKIEDILYKRFDKIDSVRAKGFITMLEREYSLNLSMWLKEYALHHNQISQPPLEDITPKIGSVADIDIKKKTKDSKNPPKEVSTAITALKLPEKDTQDKPTKPSQGGSSNTIIIVLLSLIVLGCVGYFGYKVFAQRSNTAIQKPNTLIQQTEQAPQIVMTPDSDILQNTENLGRTQNLTNMENLQSITPDRPNNAQNNDEQKSNQDTIHKSADSSGANPQNTQDSISATENDKNGKYDGIYIDFSALPQNPQAQVSESPLQDQQELLQAPQALPKPLSKLAIIPNSTLWVGVVDLEGKKSTQLNLREPYEIDLDKPYVFVFGHSDFESTLDNQTFSHRTKNFVRFYFDGKELKEINYSTYKQLNPHENWQ